MNERLIFDRTHVLLHQVEGPVNLGATCRVMANMGFHHLRFTGKLSGEERDAVKFALHASPILEQAPHHKSLARVLEGMDLVVGFTPRDPWPDDRQCPFEAFPARVTAAIGEGKTVGLLFGNEAHGLKNQALSRCHLRVALPTDAGYPSMNLSHAVLAALLTLREKSGAIQVTNDSPDYADAGKRELLSEKVIAFLESMDFFGPQNPRDLRRRCQQIFYARDWTEREWDLLMAIFNKGRSRYEAFKNRLDEDLDSDFPIMNPPA